MPDNLRMYRGQKLVGWRAVTEETRQTACYLNDRFSLDGRDVAAYGNIGWCFVRINRPSGEQKIYGSSQLSVGSGDARAQRRGGMARRAGKAQSLPRIRAEENLTLTLGPKNRPAAYIKDS